MKEYLSIPNWEELQHYKNRLPPWIKLHNKLLENYDFECLPDASKAHLVCIWLLASRTNNKINPDPKWIKRRIGANSNVDVKILIDKNFLVLNQDVKDMGQLASKPLALAPSREESRAEQSRAEDKKHLVDKSTDFQVLPPGSRFNEFWTVYPKKIGKKPCLAKWKSLNLDSISDMILKDILNRKENHRPWIEGFIMNPLTYINQNRWEDEIEAKSNKYDNGKPGIRKGNDHSYDKVDYQSGATKEEDLPDWASNQKDE